MIGQDVGFLGVIADALHRALGMVARLGYAHTNTVGRHALATPPVCDAPYCGYFSARWSIASGSQRKIGLRAAAVSSKRRRGVQRGDARKSATSPERALAARAFNVSANWSSAALLSVSVGSIKSAP